MNDVLGPNQTFRTIDRKPIYWRDKQDFVHACEGSDVHPGVRLIWTLCERDVPANAAYKCAGDTVTCATCKVRSWDGSSHRLEATREPRTAAGSLD